MCSTARFFIGFFSICSEVDERGALFPLPPPHKKDSCFRLLSRAASIARNPTKRLPTAGRTTPTIQQQKPMRLGTTWNENATKSKTKQGRVAWIRWNPKRKLALSAGAVVASARAFLRLEAILFHLVAFYLFIFLRAFCTFSSKTCGVSSGLSAFSFVAIFVFQLDNLFDGAVERRTSVLTEATPGPGRGRSLSVFLLGLPKVFIVTSFSSSSFVLFFFFYPCAQIELGRRGEEKESKEADIQTRVRDFLSS